MESFRPKIAADGVLFILPAALISWISAFTGHSTISLLFLILTCFITYFFRDPDPEIPEGDNLILSPAHGKVVSVQTRNETNFLNREMQCVSIFLSIFDCHVNRTPVQGIVKATKYNPGMFNLAFKNKASDQNENLSILVETDNKDEVVVKLITGFLARRIVSIIRLNDNLTKAQRIGLIRFGSRVDIYLPDNVKLHVTPGDKVSGGESVLGEFIQT